VTSTRKGLRNQFKALLGLRKPGSLSPETARPVTANGTYDNSSPEGQLRQLGDLAFMLQDYETAASSFQLLAADLKADRAWRQFAATQVRLSWQHAEQTSDQARTQMDFSLAVRAVPVRMRCRGVQAGSCLATTGVYAGIIAPNPRLFGP